MNYFIEVFKKYNVFTGRSRRKEYWMFVLVNMIICLVLSYVSGWIHVPILAMLYNFAVLLPAVAVGIRRMHDADHSGWWLLCPIVNLVFACQDSTPGSNRFGENPKGVPGPQGFAVVQ